MRERANRFDSAGRWRFESDHFDAVVSSPVGESVCGISGGAGVSANTMVDADSLSRVSPTL